MSPLSLILRETAGSLWGKNDFMNLSPGLIFWLATSFTWAISLVLQRLILTRGENPLNLVLWINLFALPLWLVLFNRHLTEFKKLSKKNITLLVFIGIAYSIGSNLLQSLALKNTTAVNFSFLYRTIVVFTIFFAWLFFKEKITSKKLFIVFLILTGSYLLTTKGQGLVLTSGDIYTLATAASGAFITNILVKHSTSKMHPDLSAAVTMLVVTISLFLLSFLTIKITFPRDFSLVVLTGFIYFLVIRFRNKAYTLATASFGTMIVSFTPLFVAILSFPFLGERLEMVQLIGGALIVSSGFLAEKLKM